MSSNRRRKTHSGSDRLGGVPLDQHERDQQHRPDGAGSATPGTDAHAHAWPPSSTPRISSVSPMVSGDAPRVVDLRRAAVDRFVEPPHDHPRGQHAERDVDEEDPPPGDVLAEDAAERRPDHRGDPPDAGQVALDLGAFLDGVEVADDGDGHRLDGAGAETLHGPERRSAPACSRRRPHRTEPTRNSRDAEQHDRLAAEQVGELGVDRHRDRLRQQVDREQPRELREAADVLARSTARRWR